jgi:hypothetical protein
MFGDEVNLTANVVTGPPVTSFEWRVDGVPVWANSATYSHYFVGPATISVTVTNAANQSASAYAYLSGGGTQLRTPRTEPNVGR